MGQGSVPEARRRRRAASSARLRADRTLWTKSSSATSQRLASTARTQGGAVRREPVVQEPGHGAPGGESPTLQFEHEDRLARRRLEEFLETEPGC